MSAHDWQHVRLGRELGRTGVALKTCKPKQALSVRAGQGTRDDADGAGSHQPDAGSGRMCGWPHRRAQLWEWNQCYAVLSSGVVGRSCSPSGPISTPQWGGGLRRSLAPVWLSIEEIERELPGCGALWRTLIRVDAACGSAMMRPESKGRAKT